MSVERRSNSGSRFIPNIKPENAPNWALDKDKKLDLSLDFEPSQSAAERDEIGNRIWAQLLRDFEATLNPSDQELFRSGKDFEVRTPAAQDVIHRFDDFLLTQIGLRLGWRIFMSPGMLQRLAEWEKHWPHLAKRLGEELERKSKGFRSETQIPFPEKFAEMSLVFIEQLRLIWPAKRTFCGSRRNINSADMAIWIKGEITNRPEDLYLLGKDIVSLCGFIQNRLDPKSTDSEIAFDGRRFISGDMRPTEFFDKWVAACLGRKPSSVQQERTRK